MNSFPFELRGRKIIIRPEIIFQGKSFLIPMILDTGAGRSVISKNVATYLGFDLSKIEKTERLLSANNAFFAKIVKLDSLNCFDILYENLEVAVVDIPPQAQVSGMIGVDFLMKLESFKIDFKKKSIFIDLRKEQIQ